MADISSPPNPLHPKNLRPVIDPPTFWFHTTAELTTPNDPLGRDQAVGAMDVATSTTFWSRIFQRSIPDIAKPGLGRCFAGSIYGHPEQDHQSGVRTFDTCARK